MLLVDANIFMYAAGGTHPNKGPCVALLEAAASGRIQAAVDAVTLQEILNRYRSIGRWEQGRKVYQLTRRIVPEVVPITDGIMDEARRLMDGLPGVSARDAVHAAALRISGAAGIVSYDRDFDAFPSLVRKEPSQV